MLVLVEAGKVVVEGGYAGRPDPSELDLLDERALTPPLRRSENEAGVPRRGPSGSQLLFRNVKARNKGSTVSAPMASMVVGDLSRKPS